MNITKEQLDALNAIVTINIAPQDYDEKVNSQLKDYRRKATMPGFRPGKVPFGMIKKMYGQQVLVDEVNKLLSENLAKYIREEKLNILGEPLSSEKQKPVDFANQREFEFVFDLGLAPELSIDLDEDSLNLPYYEIQVSEKMIDDQIVDMQKHFGQNRPVEGVEDGTEMIYGKLSEVPQDEGYDPETDELIEQDTVLISLQVMKDEDIKKDFMGAKTGDSIIFDLKKAYPNDTEIASMLKIDKELVENLAPVFEFVVDEVMRFEEARVDKNLFDQVYPDGEVISEGDFRDRVKEDIKKSLAHESKQKLWMDAREELSTTLEVELPVNFLKRWLLLSDNKITKEQIQEQFPDMEKEFKWQLIKSALAKSAKVEVSEDDLNKRAMALMRHQMAQYGLPNLPDEELEKYAANILNNDEQRNQIINQLQEEQLMDYVKENATLEVKEVSLDDFKALFEDQEEIKDQAQTEEEQDSTEQEEVVETEDADKA